MLPHWVEKLPKELLNLRCLSHFFFERKKRHLILILFFFPECLFLLHLLGVSVLTLLELGSYWTQNVKCFRQDGKNSISYRMPAEIWVNWCFGILQMFCWVWWLVRLHLELPEKKNTSGCVCDGVSRTAQLWKEGPPWLWTVLSQRLGTQTKLPDVNTGVHLSPWLHDCGKAQCDQPLCCHS